MAARLLATVALANVAFAYTNTIPVVAWSSSSSSILESLPSQLTNDVDTLSFMERILAQDDICNHDAIILVEHPGVHATDLRNLGSHTHFARALSSSVSARQYPYIPANSKVDVLRLAEQVSRKCNSRLLQFTPGESGVSFESDKKHVVCMKMPSLHNSGKGRKTAMEHHESLLSHELSTLSLAFPSHLTIYSGGVLPFSKRQAPNSPDRPTLDLSTEGDFTTPNKTLSKGGILKRYQILNPDIITTLLIVLFILVPVTLGGFKALASIQSPLRSDSPKSFNAQERKKQ